MKTITKIITERDGAGRLGRHVEHDPHRIGLNETDA